MTLRFSSCLLLLVVLLPRMVVAQQPATDALEQAIGLSASRDDGVEVRVRIRSNTRVSELYRLIKTSHGVRAERFAFANVVREGANGFTAREARRENSSNRQQLEKSRCSGPIVKDANYAWCRVSIRTDAALAARLFEDLLPDELWKLPPQGASHCEGSRIVLDGEAIRIEMIAAGRRHSVEYFNPDICCGTVACAVVDHARSVVRNIE